MFATSRMFFLSYLSVLCRLLCCQENTHTMTEILIVRGLTTAAVERPIVRDITHSSRRRCAVCWDSGHFCCYPTFLCCAVCFGGVADDGDDATGNRDCLGTSSSRSLGLLLVVATAVRENSTTATTTTTSTIATR